MVLQRVDPAAKPKALTETRILIASLFLPTTVAVDDPQRSESGRRLSHSHKQTSSRIKRDTIKEKSNSTVATAPPSRYHFRSVSDPNRLPYSPTIAPQPRQGDPLQSPQPAPPKTSASWRFETSNLGNIGLQNAVNSMSGVVKECLWIGQLGVSTKELSKTALADIQTRLLADYNSVPVFVTDQEREGHYTQFCKQASFLRSVVG
jgi:trehalose-6-phosphate synthase